MVNDTTFIGIIKEKYEEGFTLEVITKIITKEKKELNLSHSYTCYMNSPILEYLQQGDNIIVKASFINRLSPYNADLYVYSANRVGRDAENIVYDSYSIFVGRVGSEPTLVDLPSGKQRLSFSIAVTKKIINTDEPLTVWISIHVYQQTAIDIFKNLVSGTLLAIIGGRLQVRVVIDQNTQQEKCYSEVVASLNHITVIESKKKDDFTIKNNTIEEV